MKALGIVRHIDDLGRVVLPKELRNTMGLPEGTPMEIFTDGDCIIIRKYQPTCAICGSSDVVEGLAKHGVKLCQGCLCKALGV
jgi:transcriptional pleiotropic regulator of transition state genes